MSVSRLSWLAHVVALTSLISTALVTANAAAQEIGQDGQDAPVKPRHRHFESPQHFAAEIRISPYSPNVDSDPALNGQTPYTKIFGTSPRVLIGAEFDWQAFRIPHLGSLGPGVSAGITTASAKAPFTDPTRGVSDETTSLTIYPFAAMAVLRADALWRDVGIPLVPYAKLGVGYALWRASNTLGTSSFGGVSGKGHSFGTHVALGVSLALNVFDTYAAQNFDDAMGVNATYLFAEWTREDLTGLGLQTDPLRVGGSNWTFGLAFEF